MLVNVSMKSNLCFNDFFSAHKLQNAVVGEFFS